VEKATLKDGTIGVIVCFNSLLWVFELYESEALPFAVAFLERYVHLEQSAADPQYRGKS
jgi:hypothetical protein